MTLPPKRTIGPYTILERLGRGSMASVYRAFHHPTRSQVALKLLPTDHNLTEDRKNRFYREAELAAELNHPHIIQIIEVGEDNGHLFIAMELLSGHDLKTIMESSDPTPIDLKLDWMKELTETFSFAHSKGIIHRDIKPSNVWIRQNNSTVVMDFGIARGSSSDITRTGIILGTPDYISPEQILSVRLDQRTDIFLLGLLFYELLTKKHPFLGATPTQTAHNLLNEMPLNPVSINPAIPARVSEMILKCLNKDMNLRYQSCSEILTVLTLA